MAVRFKTTFKNALNELYTIHIHDADFAGAETLYVASGEGFELTQDGDGDNLYSPIIYTSAMIFMHVQDVNRTEIEDFIADIVDSQDENRFTVVIYDGSGQVFFRGKVQFERILIPDRHFNQITINASDGFGRLRSIPYSDNGTLYEGWETVRGHLFNVLSKLNLFGYGNYTTNSIAYGTKITYDNVTSNAFNELRFQHDAMKEIKKDGTVLPFSCHDVLTQILTRFGCRIVQKAGVFHIQELTAIAEAGPMDVYFYDKDGDFDRVYPYSYNTAIIQKLAGGQAWFREPAKSVRLDYEYRDAVGGSNLSQEIIPWKTWKNIGMVPAGNGERVAFNFDFSVEHQAGGTATMYYITYEFAIRTGTYWLSNAGGVVQWINGDNTARYKVTNMFEIDDGIAINLIHEVSFIIPELPFTGDLNVYWDWAKTRSNGAALITPPTGIDTITNLQNVIVLLYSTTEFDINEGTIVTLATGSITSGEQVELGTVVIGDLPFLRSIGRIQRYVALGQWENTELKWGHGGSELLSLTHLVTREILSLRRKNTKIIAYVIRSPYAGAANKILGNVATRASYRANSGIWDIETFVPVIDRAGIAWSDYVETDQIGGAPGGITLPPPPAGTFIGLNDTPVSYAGQAGKVPQVNSAETGLEWGSGGGGSSYEYWKLKGGKVPKYGLLYNWYALTDVRNINSAGWELPTLDNYKTLGNYLGADNNWSSNGAGGKLKETGLIHWNTPNSSATNEVLFNSRGGGYRGTGGVFSGLRIYSELSTISTYSTYNYTAEMNKDNGSLYGLRFYNKGFGLSVRLFRLATVAEQLLADGTACDLYEGNDGKLYRTVKIGNQVWLADNLAETKFRNGDWIHGFDGGVYTPISNEDWAALTTAGVCAYDDDLTNVFMQNDVNINSHDIVTFKESSSVAFSVTENEDGEKEITAEAIGGHPRAHQIDSIEDHPAVPAEKRNRWVHTNAETGEIELVEQGPQGDPGTTPFIGENGNWWIGETDTGVQAEGEDGNDGINPHIGVNGNWWVGTFDTGIKAAGTDGEDGITPHIGGNGNWYVGTTDTGIKAHGGDGDNGDSAYVYLAYASDDQGADFSLTFNATSSNPRTYIAALTTTTPIATPIAANFTGLWMKFVGEDGTGGNEDLTHFTYMAWRDSPGTAFTLTPNVNLEFEAILVTHTELTSPVEADFAGLWRARVTPSNVHGIPKGGITGQVLKKISEEDYVANWQDDAGGVSNFTELNDVTINSYQGNDKKIPIVNETANQLDMISSVEAQSETLTSLLLVDMPQSLTGKAGYVLRVKADETGYELVDPALL